MKRLTFVLLSVGLLAVSQSPTRAQSDNEILAPIHQLFDGMRAGDSTAVRDAFAPEATMVRTTKREGVPTYRLGSVDDFAAAVGAPHDKVWDERIWDVKVESQDNLASVWMKFAFFAGDEFSHCGVNSFELVNTADGWKIINIADTAQREGCEMPPSEEGGGRMEEGGAK